jgi:hypothetical protein
MRYSIEKAEVARYGRNSADKRVWTMVSEDGKHAAAGMSLAPVGTKPCGGGEA